MAYLTHVATLSGGAITYGRGIADLEIHWQNGQPVLYSGSFSEAGIGRYAIAGGLDEVQSLSGALRNGQVGLSDLGIVRVGGTDYLFAPGRYSDQYALRAFRPDGGVGGLQDLSGPNLAGTSVFASARAGGSDYLITATWGEPGLRVFRIGADFALTLTGAAPATPKSPLSAVSDIEVLRVAGQDYVIAASASAGGLTALRLLPNGRLETSDMLSAGLGLGWSGTSSLAVVQADGGPYILVGSAGSGTLSVLRLTERGLFTVIDQRVDDLSTRFGGVQDIATFSHAGRTFVVAGGSDDGIALFELGPGGRLYHMQSLAHQAGWSLDNVSAIAATVTGGQAQIFVAGEGTNGISQFTIDLGRFGTVLVGNGPGAVLAGTANDDHLEGGAGNDRLLGGGGADRLVAGDGVTTMTGGAGADVFVFRRGHGRDRITDFQDGVDRIDLSDHPMLYSIDGIGIRSTATGAVLTIGSDTIVIETMNGRPLRIQDFGNDDFIFD